MAGYFICVFMCVLLTAFTAWEPQKVKWWMVSAISISIVMTGTFLVILWGHDWSFQDYMQGFHSVKDVIFELLFFSLSAIVPLILTAYVSARTKQAWRVGAYAIAIFLASILLLAIVSF